MKEYLSIIEFAELLSLHPNTIRNAIKNKRINAFKIGSGSNAKYRIARSEIHRMAFIDLNSVINIEVEKRINEKLI